VALVLAFWCIHQPLKVGMAAGFVLGLAMDVADASVMGQHALAYVLLAYFAAGWSRRVLWFPLAQQALHVLPMLLGMQMVMLVTRMVGGAEFPGVLWFLSSITATLLWHPDHLRAADAAVPAGGQGCPSADLRFRQRALLAPIGAGRPCRAVRGTGGSICFCVACR
jgi:rod shape-determining protein MreD